MYESIFVKINGMKGEESKNTINSKLEALEGIKSAQVSLENEEVKVDYNTDLICLNEIIETIQGAGYEVVQE
jgi:copper chaperone